MHLDNLLDISHDLIYNNKLKSKNAILISYYVICHGDDEKFELFDTVSDDDQNILLIISIEEFFRQMFKNNQNRIFYT